MSDQVQVTLTLSRDDQDTLLYGARDEEDSFAILARLRAALTQQEGTAGDQPFTRTLAERIKAELHSDVDGTTCLAGPLGEAIATASGNYSLEFTTPEQVAEGICNWLATQQEGQEVEEQYPAEICKRCGGENAVWFAASPLWNAVMRGGSIDGEPIYGDMVCARCFMVLAEERGIASRFRVDAEVVNVTLETVTPSGRVWDRDRFLWVDPTDETDLPDHSEDEEGRDA